MLYRVILISNGEYKKTIHRCKTKETAFMNYHSLIEKNGKVKFPKKFINTGKIKPVKYMICVTKPTTPDDVFRTIRDDYGKTYTEKPIGDWTILASEDYNLEETFWIYGYDSKLNRPIVDDIIKKLVANAYKKKLVKQIIVVHNKLIIYNEEQFDMVICKCIEDAQRLHHTLAKIAKKQKIKSLLFMGTASQATVSRMYEIIKEHTGWPIKKIRRTTTRP
jgi:hypothetical protein